VGRATPETTLTPARLALGATARGLQ
jgi:hypothetical protein